MNKSIPKSVMGLIIITGLSVISGCGPLTLGTPKPEQVIRNVVYGEQDGVKLKLDVYVPKGKAPYPVLMEIHGGGWHSGDKSRHSALIREISSAGFLVFSINYRLAPRYRFPSAVDDCLMALRWVKLHCSEYGGDPYRVGVFGESAGGHLSAMIATAVYEPFFKERCRENCGVDSSIKAVVSFFGFFDFSSEDVYENPNLKYPSIGFYGYEPRKNPEMMRLGSPRLMIHKDLPPFLLICGDKDFMLAQNLAFYKSLKDAGINAELKIYTGESHGFILQTFKPNSKKAISDTINFFNFYLK